MFDVCWSTPLIAVPCSTTTITRRSTGVGPPRVPPPHHPPPPLQLQLRRLLRRLTSNYSNVTSIQSSHIMQQTTPARCVLALVLATLLFTFTFAATVGASAAPSTSSPTATTTSSSSTDPPNEQNVANNFLSHHILQNRTFAAGFRPSHTRQYLDSLRPSAATCDCSLSFVNSSSTIGDISLESSQCRLPRRFWISTAVVNTKPFTPKMTSHLSSLLGDIGNVHMVPITSTSFSCIDGRAPHNGMIGGEVRHDPALDQSSLPLYEAESRSPKTFGGDFGEFLYLLQATAGPEVNIYEPAVFNMMRSWIDRNVGSNDPASTAPAPMNKLGQRHGFYYHTDVATLERIAANLGYTTIHRNRTWIGPLLSATVHGDDVNLNAAPVYLQPSASTAKEIPYPQNEDEQLPYLDMTNPPLHLQSLLLDALSKPQNQGCTHLRLMMTYPELYGVGLTVIRYAIRSYFKILWNKDLYSAQSHSESKIPLYHKLRFVVSKGEHDARMWLNIKTTRTCDAAGVTPIVMLNQDVERMTRWEMKRATFSMRKAGEPKEIEEQRPQETPATSKKNKKSKKIKHTEQALIYYPQAVQHLREEMAIHLMTKKGKLGFGGSLELLNRIGDTAHERTKQLLAKRMPEYNVRVV